MMNSPRQSYPKTWKEMSLDFKLMYVYHGSMMVMFMVGTGLTIQQEIVAAVFLAGVLSSISIRHRRQTNWRWPGVRIGDVVNAIGAVVFLAFFFFAATPLFPPSAPRALPWYLAGLGIGTFTVLSFLKVVHSSETAFLLHCRVVDQNGQEIALVSELPEAQLPADPRWKKLVRGIFSTVFILVWIGGVLSFYYFGESFKNGSPVQTTSHTEPLNNHGKIVFVTPAEKQRIDRLQTVSFVGIALVVAGTVFLHFVADVKLFPNTPTLADYWKKKSSGT